MAREPRTFKVRTPAQRGQDIRAWQHTLNRRFAHWGVDYRVSEDGVYGAITRDATATVLHGLGIEQARMREGVEPELRTKVRHSRLTREELRRYHDRRGWRRRLAQRHAGGGKVHTPLAKIHSSSWGYHPPVHDGVDLICPPNAIGYAICDGTIIRADASGWWGKGAPSDPAVRARGDGVVVLRCEVNTGPFRKGLNFVYGHAEHPQVRVGQRVQAGQPICRAGLANAWHFHLCVNSRGDAKGVGDRDPMPFVNYARR